MTLVEERPAATPPVPALELSPTPTETADLPSRQSRSRRPDVPEGLDVDTLRELFRNLIPWRSVYETDGVEIINLPDGGEISIHDVEYLLALATALPIRQRQAIHLCLVMGYSEEMAAHKICIDGSNPVAMYATAGIQTILSTYRLGLAPSRARVYAEIAKRRRRTVMILAPVVLDEGCAWAEYEEVL